MTVDTFAAQFITELGHLYREALRAIEQQTGMSQTRLEIMHELLHADEISQAELQRRLGVEGPVITRIVKQLEAAGLLSRRPDPRDNRYTLVSLTAEIRASQRSGTDTVDFKESFGAQLLSGLDSDDQLALLSTIKRIADNARAIQGEVQEGYIEIPLTAPNSRGWEFHVTLIHLYRDVVGIVEQQTGMSFTRLEIMNALYHADEISQAELQQRLGSEGAVITRIVKQLEVDHILTRRADPADNRYTLVALSAEGRRQITDNKLDVFTETLGEKLLAGLDDQARVSFQQAISRLRQNIAAMPEVRHFI